MTVLASLANARAADEAADEAKKVAGRYERYFQNAAGLRFRAIKEERDGRSLVTTYDDVGNILEAHTAEFKLEKRGPVRVFSFFNLTVIAGPNKGLTQPATSSFLYRVDDQQFVEVWGLLEGDTAPPHMLIWKRLKENE
jgi:hypothetical protein